MEVRCCCDAGKLLGYMDLPPGVWGGMPIWVVIDGVEYKLEVATCFVDGHETLAIKDNGLTVEQLRQVPNFREIPLEGDFKVGGLLGIFREIQNADH